MIGISPRLVPKMADLVSAKLVADFLLTESRERGEILTNLKLQKLMYYAQAWHLALANKSLFEEDFEAWVHGPVLPSQYHRFSDYKWRPIVEEIPPTGLDGDVATHLNLIIDVFGSETGVALELMTHREKPWVEARGDLAPHEPSRNPISKLTMREYYKALQT